MRSRRDVAHAVPVRLAALALLAAAGLAACGGASSGGSSGSGPASTPASATTGGGQGGSGGSATTVTADESEFTIVLSTTAFSPGSYTFVAKNVGHTTHALEISGPGITGDHTKDLSPGESADLKVTLSKGRYDIFCPVGDHKMLGMNVDITVA